MTGPDTKSVDLQCLHICNVYLSIYSVGLYKNWIMISSHMYAPTT